MGSLPSESANYTKMLVNMLPGARRRGLTDNGRNMLIQPLAALFIKGSESYVI